MNDLTLDGSSLNSEFRRITDKAEVACEISTRVRTAGQVGRRESDLANGILNNRLEILTEMLGKALEIAKGGSFTEQDLNTIEVAYREVGIHG